MPKVIINGKTYRASEGENLMEVARRGGAHMGFVCDGRGFCSTCECKVLQGAGHLNDYTQAELDWLGQSRLERGYRLACQTEVEGNGTVGVLTRAEFLRCQFLAAFDPPAGEGRIANTARFFSNLTTITTDHLSQAPTGLVNTVRRVGPFRFLFPWRDVSDWLGDTSRTLDHQLNEPASCRPNAKRKVVVEVLEEIDEIEKKPDSQPSVDLTADPTLSEDTTIITEAVAPAATEAIIVNERGKPLIFIPPTVPFDFLPIEDIGEVFNRRLFEGGVYSYRAFAALSPERLAEICQSSTERVIRNQWREQATKLADEAGEPSA